VAESPAGQDTRASYRWIITADRAEVERLRALHQPPADYHTMTGLRSGGRRATASQSGCTLVKARITVLRWMLRLSQF
jgi:hypothetical protein